MIEQVNRSHEGLVAAICAQDTAHDALLLLEAMGRTSHGRPDAYDLTLGMVRQRRYDLFGVIPQAYPGFCVSQNKERDILVDLTHALHVSVGDGAHQRLHPENEEALGIKMVEHGILPLDELFSIDLHDASRSNSVIPTNTRKNCWIFGRSLNSGLTIGLLKGALGKGVEKDNTHWQKLLQVVAPHAIDRCIRTHSKRDLGVDTLIGFLLAQVDVKQHLGTPLVKAVMQLHATRKQNSTFWSLSRAACDQMVESVHFCKAAATTRKQVRGWIVLGEREDILNPDIFLRAGSTPEAMAVLAAHSLWSRDKHLLNKTIKSMDPDTWSEDDRLDFILSLSREMEWIDRNLIQEGRHRDAGSKWLPELLSQVQGCDDSGKIAAAAIEQRLALDDKKREDRVLFEKKLCASISSARMKKITDEVSSTSTPSKLRF